MKALDIRIFDTLPDDSRRIRTEVFVDEQGFREEFDTDDNIATHIVGYINGNPVATCRILPQKGCFTIGRVAVAKSFRNNGLGSRIIIAAEEHISKCGGGIIYIHSQLQAAPFYEKLGYKPTGETDFEEGCPHCMLTKHI